MTNGRLGTIVVIDDEVELKNILVEALNAQGYEAVGFSSADDALAALRGQPFDILLTDLMMPGMDGIALVRAGLQIDPNLVCIMMTGQGTIQTAVDAMKLGTFDYVLKPFRMQTMLPVLTRAMNARHLRVENVQLREAVAIHELSKTIAFTLDPQIVLSKLADAALVQTEADEVSVLLPTAAGDEFYVAVVRGEKRERLLGERIPFGESISSWVARQQEPIILDGEVDDDRFVALWPRPDIRSSVSVPMLVAKKLIGVLNLNAVDRLRPFTLGQMKALTILAGTAAAALESASLHTQVQQAEADYRSIFENACEGIFRTGTDGKFITANPAMAEILGYQSPDELMAEINDVTRQRYVDPKRQIEWERRLQVGERVTGFEAQYRRKDGSLVWLSDSAHAVRDEDDAVLYYEGIAEDITQRKLAEESLRDSEERYRDLVENAHDIIYCHDLKGNYTSSNRAGEEITGYTRAESLQLNFTQTVAPEYQDKAREMLTRKLAGEEITAYDLEIVAKDGHRILVEVNTRLLLQDGVPVGVTGIARDITERKRAEEKVRKSETRYRSLFENMLEGFAYCQMLFENNQPQDFIYLDVNSSFEELTGLKNVVGKKVSELIPGIRESSPELFEIYGRVALSGNPERFEIYLETLGIWFSISAYGAGKEHFVAVFDNITERKRAEAERRLIFDITQGIITTPDLDELLELIHHSICKLLYAENCFVALHDPITNLLHFEHWADKYDPVPPPHPPGRGFASYVLRTNQPLLLTKELKDQMYRSGEVEQSGRSSASWLGVPLRTPSRAIGVLVVQHYEDEHAYSQRDLEFLSSVGDQIALAIERKRAEEALNLFRTLIDQSSDAIEVIDPDTARFLDVNEKGCSELGYSREEFLSLKVFDIDPGVDQSNFTGSVEELRRLGFMIWEGFHQRKDGTQFPVEVNIKYVQLDRAYLVTVVRDITERKRAEEKLRESEAGYRDLVESSSEMILTHDLDGVILSANRAAELVFGYLPEGYLGKWNLRDLLAPEVRDEFDDYLARLSSDGMASGLMLIRNSSGQRRVLEYHNTLRTEGVAAPIVRGMARDITERTESEARIRGEQAFSESIINSLPGIFYVFDQAGKFLRWNTNFERVTGYSAAEIAELSPLDLFSGEEKELLAGRIQEVFASGESDAEASLISQSGQRTPYYFTGVRIDLNKEPCLIGVGLDISERRLVEDALRASEDQLRQSQKLEAIGQLAGGVAHDFNNLLTAINGYSSLALQRIEDNHPLRGYLEEIKKAGDRAANLTRQLLAFGRKQILQPLPVNLNELVTDMNKMLRRLIGEDIELTAKLDPALRRIKADPGQIEQVLVNLVVNARDAMPQGGNLTIETATVELDQSYADTHVGIPPGNYVMLAVSDTGTGMDDETKARIFDPFFTTKEKGKGTGLGLSTVYGIVKQSGGSIWVYSELGHGTTFKVYLRQLETALQRAEAPVVESPLPVGTETILLVEDEDVVRSLAQQILEQSGYKVLAASRGKEAIRLCRQSTEPIHLLLTDVVMPETSGKEVADRLRELFPGLRVLFMSGYTDESIVHHGVLDSNVEFIQKPFTPNALVKKVREVLDVELVTSD